MLEEEEQLVVGEAAPSPNLKKSVGFVHRERQKQVSEFSR